MKALIIGGSGFVGSYLIQELQEAWGWQVEITKLPSESCPLKTVEVYDLDITDKEAVSSLLAKVQADYIFHLAAMSSVSLSWKNPGLTVDINIKGTLNVLDALKDSKIHSRLILIGSGEEYGHILPGELPLRESNHVRPGNLYAATKAFQNMAGRIYQEAYNLDIISVRAFNHIGPRQLPTFVVSDFCKQIAEIECGLKDPLMKVGNLSARRDFTDVRDVVRAYVLLAQKGVSGETYNVGTGTAYPIQHILDSLLDLSKVQIEVASDPVKMRPVDVPEIAADISKLQSATGWTPRYGLPQTLSDTLDYWRDTVRS